MRLEEAREKLKRFVKQKTTQQPAFLGVIMDALDAVEQLDLYHGGEIRCYFDGDTLKALPKYATEIVFETEEEQEEFEARIKAMSKYRWHDLRKDPDDLPKPDDESVMFYCILENHIHDPHPIPLYFEPEYYNAFGYYNNSYSVANGADVFDTVEAMGYEKVIAWREIEPFEEENK